MASAVLLQVMATAVAEAQTGPFVYVPNSGDGTVSVLDTSTGNFVGSPIGVGSNSIAAAVRGDESIVYITDYQSGTVSVLDTSSNAITATIAVGAYVAGVALTPDGTRAYVAVDNSVSVINTATNAIITTVNLGGGLTGLALSPDGTRAYVANYGNNSISVINTATNTIITTIPDGTGRPMGVAISPDGTHAYVANQGGNSVSVIDTATNAISTTIPVGSAPAGVALSPDGTRAYVANYGSNSVSVINTATNAIITTISVGSAPFGVAFSPDGTVAYVTNQGDNSVSVIDTATNAVNVTLSSPGAGPAWLGACSNGNALLAAGSTFKANTSGALACTLASGASGASGPVFTGGTMQFAGANISSSLPITLMSQGGTFDTAGNDVTLSGTISGPGGLTKIGLGTLTLSGAGSYSGPTVVNAGTLQAGAAGVFSPNSAYTVASGAILDLNSFNQTIGSLAGAGSVTLGSAALTIGNDGTSTTFSGSIVGAGGLTKIGAGTLTLSGNNAYSGGTMIGAGTLQLSGAGTLGAATGSTMVNGGTLDLGGTTQTQAAVSLAGGMIQNGNLNAPITSTGGTINGISGTASLTTTSGTTVVTGTNTYSGGTTVNGGVLDVLGALSDPTVSAGGTLTGSGSVGDTFVNTGGTFAPGSGVPGSFMTVNGSLAFQSGAIYLVQLNPSTASFANVTGTAALGGATVNAVFASGSYVSRTYTILTASGGVSGTFDTTVVNTNLPANFHTTLSYDGNNAYLNLVLNFSIPGGQSGNQRAVGNALSNFFNANGSIPLTYGALTPAGLTQASGELGASSQQTTFAAMSQFMGLLTDPFMQRNGVSDAASGASGFADEDSASAYVARKRTDAFAMITKAPPRTFEQRWSVWAAGFGGSQTTGGNAIVGSNDTTSRIFGTAAGADYRFSANTLAGFALAGGGTNFSVANGLGSGRSDLFQAGAYLRHANGPAYISAALAYGWQDITTDRTVTIAGADRLRAEFDANAYSGRLEGGYRFVAPWIGSLGITPYGAAQFVTFDLPAYAEQVVSGSSAFALSYAAKSVTDTRTELGLRGDKSFAMQGGVLTLRGRTAWAHDFNPDRSIAATFQALPGASFVVNGAAQAHDSALTTLAVEMNWLSGWSAAASFEGEFSNVTRSYAGKGSVRYVW
ncbi:autotransporter domain-containing protein [Bradyrhizobium sp. USDA 377]